MIPTKASMEKKAAATFPNFYVDNRQISEPITVLQRISPDHWTDNVLNQIFVEDSKRIDRTDC